MNKHINNLYKKLNKGAVTYIGPILVYNGYGTIILPLILGY
jgi:hypothetical protein